MGFYTLLNNGLSGPGPIESVAFRFQWGYWSNTVTKTVVSYSLGKKRK